MANKTDVQILRKRRDSCDIRYQYSVGRGPTWNL